MKCLAALVLLLAVICLASVTDSFRYDVFVYTGNKFNSTEGSIKLSILTNLRKSNETRIVDNNLIKSNSTYRQTIDVPFNVQEIQKVKVRFTMKSFSLRNRQISVKNVVMVPTYLENPYTWNWHIQNFTDPNSKDVAISHHEEKFFYKTY